MNKNARYVITALLVLALAALMPPALSGTRRSVHAKNSYTSALDEYFADYMETPSGEGNLFGCVAAPIMLSISVPLYSLAYVHDESGVVCVKPTIRNHSTCPIDVYLFPAEEQKESAARQHTPYDAAPEYVGTVHSLDQISLEIENRYKPTSPNSKVLGCHLTFEISMSP